VRSLSFRRSIIASPCWGSDLSIVSCSDAGSPCSRSCPTRYECSRRFASVAEAETYAMDFLARLRGEIDRP